MAQIAPGLVVLSAQQLHTAAALQASAEAVAGQGVPLTYGGLIFYDNPLLQARLPGQYIGNDLEAAPDVVERLVAEQPASPAVSPPDTAHRQTLELYMQRRALIEAHVWGRFVGDNQPTAYLATVNNDVAQTITGALRLGDIRLLPADVTWYAHLLMGYRLPPDWLAFYIDTYLEAIRIHLESAGSLLVGWAAELQASSSEPDPTTA